MGNNHSTPFSLGQIIKRIECIDISNLGYGVFKHQGITIFAQNALVGEEVDLKIYDIKKKFLLATITKYYNKSESRLENVPKNNLNANRYINYAYQTQVEIKEKQMSKLFNQDVKLVQAYNLYNYRNKSEFFYANNKLNMLDEFNNYKAIKSCILSNDKINQVLPYIEEALNNNQKAKISSVIIRYSKYQDALMLIFVSDRINKYQTKIAQEIVGANDKVKSVILNYGPSKNYLFNNDEIVIYGDDYIMDSMFNKEFKITSKSFYQINEEQTKKLYQTIIDFGEFKDNDNIADLYCGVGTIGIILSDYVKSVVGVEVVADAVRAAKDNIELNDISNYQVFEHDLDQDISILEGINTVVVDPPRNGLSKLLIENIAKSQVKNVIYVSCNPYTQKRDLDIFTQLGFKLDKVSAVDMFINTHHVETVCLLSRKDK